MSEFEWHWFNSVATVQYWTIWLWWHSVQSSYTYQAYQIKPHLPIRFAKPQQWMYCLHESTNL